MFCMSYNKYGGGRENSVVGIATRYGPEERSVIKMFLLSYLRTRSVKTRQFIVSM
jgi:hypothetical protein